MRWSKKEHITDGILKNVIDEISNGLIDADLGGGLVKKRVSRKGEGKRGGHRVLLAFKTKTVLYLSLDFQRMIAKI